MAREDYETVVSVLFHDEGVQYARVPDVLPQVRVLELGEGAEEVLKFLPLLKQIDFHIAQVFHGNLLFWMSVTHDA
jgi:hypothetical protein